MVKLTLKLVAEDDVINDIIHIIQDNLKDGHVTWAEKKK